MEQYIADRMKTIKGGSMTEAKKVKIADLKKELEGKIMKMFEKYSAKMGGSVHYIAGKVSSEKKGQKKTKKSNKKSVSKQLEMEAMIADAAKSNQTKVRGLSKKRKERNMKVSKLMKGLGISLGEASSMLSKLERGEQVFPQAK